MSLTKQISPATKSGRFSLLASQVLRAQEQTAQVFRERLFSVSEARVALGGLHQATVRRFIRNGLLKAVRVGEHGHFKIPFSEIRRLRGETEK
jgi:excisionase family DNA binding protein